MAVFLWIKKQAIQRAQRKVFWDNQPFHIWPLFVTSLLISETCYVRSYNNYYSNFKSMKQRYRHGGRKLSQSHECMLECRCVLCLSFRRFLLRSIPRGKKLKASLFFIEHQQFNCLLPSSIISAWAEQVWSRRIKQSLPYNVGFLCVARQASLRGHLAVKIHSRRNYWPIKWNNFFLWT